MPMVFYGLWYREETGIQVSIYGIITLAKHFLSQAVWGKALTDAFSALRP